MTAYGLYKKRILSAIIIACFVSGTLMAGERSAVWSRLYRNTSSLDEKLAFMQGVARNPTPDFIPLLIAALDELNERRERITDAGDLPTYVALTQIVVRLIGEAGAVEAGRLVLDVSRHADDPQLRGEAILTIGRLGMRESASDAAITLRNLNLNLDPAKKAGAEALAFACILALERLKEPVGFTPLFYASIGWYSPESGVRSRAAAVMNDLVDDPTDMLFDVVRLERNPRFKLEGLLAAERSRAPLSGKIKIATEALRQSLVREPTDVSEQQIFGRLRHRSMEMLIEQRAVSEESIRYLAEVMTGEFDIDERITSIEAIGAQGTPYAIRALVGFLRMQNQRQLAGITPEDYRIVLSTIRVLGQTGSDYAVEELRVVDNSNWPETIAREAEKSLELLGY
jgi:HEAT repeat protein